MGVPAGACVGTQGPTCGVVLARPTLGTRLSSSSVVVPAAPGQAVALLKARWGRRRVLELALRVPRAAWAWPTPQAALAWLSLYSAPCEILRSTFSGACENAREGSATKG